MAALPRSEVSFRRSGSSGLVWDDKLLSGELKPIKPKDEEDKIEKGGNNRSEPRPYRTVEVEPTFDPPSPKVSGCVCFGGKKPAKKANQHPKQQNHKKPSSATAAGNRKSS